MITKLKITSLAAAVLLLASGCTFNTSIDNLMSPPKLSVEQEQIYSALTDELRSSVSLKYPKSGKYLSAFIIEDIDGDGGDEAVVFYEKNSLGLEENPLRISILDQDDGKWRSVCDTSAEGTEIEKVMISKLGSNDRVNLIIESSLINRSEKNAAIYTYDSANGTVIRTFSESCSFIDVTDLDGDDQNEFLMLSGSVGGAPAAAEAYKLDAEGTYHHYSCELNGSFTEFDSISYGEIGGARKALYIDSASGTGSIQTDVIYMDSTGLSKVFSTPEEAQATVRPAGCSATDIDGDGILEIPVQVISPGYDNVSESEQMKLTNWMYVTSDNRLEYKYSSYLSVNSGYTFLFPEKWRGRVTVRRDTINEEIVFCTYAGGQTGRELMRIYFSEDLPSREDRLSNGYMLMHTKGDSAWLAYIPEYSELYDDDLSAAAGDAAVGFRFKD